MSYSAIIARVKVRPHPKADRLQLGTVAGHQVVVGLDTKDGEVGVFFPADGQLSEQMVVANNLYSKEAMTKLGIAFSEDHKFGFFSDKRRVRAQSFRGEKSDGYWVPLTYLVWTGAIEAVKGTEPVVYWYDTNVIKEGDEIASLNGHEICRKYVTAATLRQAGQNVGRKQRENKCFPKHDDTKQFKYVSDAIPADAVLYITEKLHGTSGRYGCVLDERSLPWWTRAWNSVAITFNIHAGCSLPVFPSQEYRHLNGSKNVILEKTTGEGYYGTNKFRYQAIDGVTLHKGEILYFEIVGFVGERPIMDPQPIKDELKSLKKIYGDAMLYRYGQASGTCAIYVYKIVRVNEDGNTIELAWPQVVARCAELGLKTVPMLVGPLTFGEMAYWDRDLANLMDGATNGPSTLDAGHIREGVVLRVESSQGISHIKNKSWTFGVLEGYIKDSETYVDTEEAA